MTPARSLPLLALLLACASTALAAGEPGAAVRAEALREEITALAGRIEAGRSARDDAVAALERTEKAIVALIAERDALAERIDAVERRIEALDAATADADRRLPILRGELDAALRTRYRLSRATRASILFDQEDPARIQRMMTYFDELLDAQTRRIESLSEQIDIIVTARDELAARRAELERSRAAHDDKVAALKQRNTERGEQLEDIRRRLSVDSDLLADKRDEKARLETLLDGIEQLRRDAPPPMPAADDAPPADAAAPAPESAGDAEDQPRAASITLDGLAHLKGDLPLPVGGRITTRFNEPDALSGVPSSGIVIAAGEAADVRSVSAGQVVYSGWFRGFGLLLVIDHGDGFMSLYGYNSRLLYPIGATVAAGTTVAKAGNTGGRARSGVYFEIRQGGNAVDPLQWCRPRRG